MQLKPEQELKLIKEKHHLTYITYVSMMQFYLANLEVYRKYVMKFSASDIEDQKKTDEEKKEADTIFKFGKDIMTIKGDLEKLRLELNPAQIKAADLEVANSDETDFSAEDYLSRKNK
jgi:hypothetical protein